MTRIRFSFRIFLLVCALLCFTLMSADGVIISSVSLIPSLVVILSLSVMILAYLLRLSRIFLLTTSVSFLLSGLAQFINMSADSVIALLSIKVYFAASTIFLICQRDKALWSQSTLLYCLLFFVALVLAIGPVHFIINLELISTLSSPMDKLPLISSINFILFLSLWFPICGF